jgi:hypothetical protein
MRGNWPIDEIGQGHEKRDIRATAPPQLELGVACHHSFHHHHYLLLYLLFIKPNHLMIAHIVLWRVRWCRDEKASDEDKRDKWKSRASRRWSKDPTLWLVNYQAPFLASNILSQERWSKNPHSTRCVKTTWSNQSFATKFRVRKELFKTSKVVVKGPGNHCSTYHSSESRHVFVSRLLRPFARADHSEYGWDSPSVQEGISEVRFSLRVHNHRKTDRDRLT